MGRFAEYVIKTEKLPRRFKAVTAVDGLDLNVRSAGQYSGMRRWIFFGLPLLLGVALYWPVLVQPFFWDDLPTFQFVVGRTYPQMWTDVYGLAYYRPVTFTLYKFFFGLLPAGSTLMPHLFMLWLHVANGWLVGLLTRRVLSSDRLSALPGGLPSRQREAASLVAALLFVSYPFAGLPVSHFAALVYPLVTLFTLGATAAALEFARARRKRWLAVAVVLSFLAPFAHESGVMAGWIAAMVWLFYDRRLAWQNRRLLVLLPGASSAFLLVWLAIPRSPENVAWIGGQGLLASGTFFLQGPTFPLQPLSRVLIDWLTTLNLAAPWTVVGLPWWVVGAVWLVAGIALLAAGFLLWRVGLGSILGLALGWTVLAALPSIVALPFSYITVSQRLLYVAGPPASLLWAVVCVSVAVGAGQPLARNVAALGLAAIVLVPSMFYVRREMALHELALRPLAQLVTIARRFPDERHLVVNPVNWVNYRRPWYALGHEGVAVSADYVDFGQLVRLNSGNNTRFRAVTFAPIREELEHHYYSTIGEEEPWDWSAFATRAAAFGRVWLTTYADDAIDVLEAGSVRAGSATAPGQYLASFEGRVFLVGGELEVRGNEATAILDWQYLADVAEVTIFRHVYDCSGRLLGQADGHALGRVLPFVGLAPGAEVRDVRQITLDAVSGDDCYLLGVGLYRPDGTRVVAAAQDGQTLENDVVLVPVR